MAFVLFCLACWIANSVALGLLAARLLRKLTPARWARWLAGLTTSMAVFISPPFLFIAYLQLSATSSYVDGLPSAFEIDKTIETETELMRCGLGVFRYSDATHQALRDGGVDWLNSAARAARHQKYRNYLAWSSTPVLNPQDITSAVRACLEGNEKLTSEIHDALVAPGSYLTNTGRRHNNTHLLLIPARRLIVYMGSESD